MRLRHVVHRQQVLKITGLSSTELYRLIGAGLFPPQIKLGPKSCIWFLDEIEVWLALKCSCATNSEISKVMVQLVLARPRYKDHDHE